MRSSINRTQVYVATGRTPTAQGALPTSISTVQGGINAAVAGGTIRIADSAYVLTSTVAIDKGLTLIGQSHRILISTARSRKDWRHRSGSQPT